MSQLIVPRRLRGGCSLFGLRNQRGFIINPYALATGGGGSYTTLNPSDKAANLTLSPGNLIVTAGTSSAGIVRSIGTITGKKYFEAVFGGGQGTTAGMAAGIATSAHSLTASLGYANAFGWAFWGPSTGARHNGVTAIAGSSTTNDVFGFAVDEPLGSLWIRKNGTWIQGDPATNTSPIWTNLSGTLYAAACPWTAGGVMTMRFDPASFSNAAPSGFGAIP